MTSARHEIPLRDFDVVAGRSFAHPDHVVTDAATMRFLIDDLLRHLLEVDGSSESVVRYIPSQENWYRRVILPAPGRFAALSSFTVVGFFGRRRDEVSAETADAVEALGRALVSAIPHAPGLLAYTTHLLADERNYANLVVFESPDQIQPWRDTEPHPIAAEVISPDYYDHVRIYRGGVVVTSRPAAGFELNLDRVRYWDFRSQPPWQAQRLLTR